MANLIFQDDAPQQRRFFCLSNFDFAVRRHAAAGRFGAVVFVYVIDFYVNYLELTLFEVTL
ncbi:hypothetical protein LXM60_09595 [Pandoraea sputorum]|uniref:hypothetical protein n=1 Tax=Pandoraea sputorum TaxID=93222 RepID=UPI001E4580E1|nr:hypothetical protein [Pandoraea sputorum]MCE4060454.1 hypothetical protein [Pandoraea sputorum]